MVAAYINYIQWLSSSHSKLINLRCQEMIGHPNLTFLVCSSLATQAASCLNSNSGYTLIQNWIKSFKKIIPRCSITRPLKSYYLFLSISKSSNLVFFKQIKQKQDMYVKIRWHQTQRQFIFYCNYIHKDRSFWINLLKNNEMVLKNGIINIQVKFYK